MNMVKSRAFVVTLSLLMIGYNYSLENSIIFGVFKDVPGETVQPTTINPVDRF